jgi:hypothetical protein
VWRNGGRFLGAVRALASRTWLVAIPVCRIIWKPFKFIGNHLPELILSIMWVRVIMQAMETVGLVVRLLCIARRERARNQAMTAAALATIANITAENQQLTLASGVNTAMDATADAQEQQYGQGQTVVLGDGADHEDYSGE